MAELKLLNTAIAYRKESPFCFWIVIRVNYRL